MALTREEIVDTAWEILRQYGLADLSMRRLARELGVQPGALYWHVANKQELLTVLAERLVAPLTTQLDDAATPHERARNLTRALRHAVLSVRDGAEVVGVAHALDPLSCAPVPQLAATLESAVSNPADARNLALTLVRFTLGSVATQQNRESLGLGPGRADEEFEAGLTRILP